MNLKLRTVFLINFGLVACCIGTFLACSQKPVKNESARLPASDPKACANTQSLDFAMDCAELETISTNDLIKKVDDKYNRISLLYTRSNYWVDAFDAELDKALKSPGKKYQVSQSGNYATINAYWQTLQQDKHDLVLFYLKLQNRSAESAKARTGNLFRSINEKISALLNNWKRQPLVYNFVKDELDSHGVVVTSAEFKLISKQKMNQLYKEMKLKAKLLRREDHPEINDVETLGEKIHSEVQEEDRSPSSVTKQALIEPSTDKNGNIFGLEFPEGQFALTYDDGPSGKYTPQFIDYFKQKRMSATFFMLAQQIYQFPDVAKNVLAAGHIIGNHSFTHADLSKADGQKLQYEIVKSSEIQNTVLGRLPTYFRCPYGAGFKDSPARNLIVANKMIHVHWLIDSLDWQDKNIDSIVKRVQKQMSLYKRGIILFHDIHPQSLDATKKLVETMPNTRWTNIEQAVEGINASRR